MKREALDGRVVGVPSKRQGEEVVVPAIIQVAKETDGSTRRIDLLLGYVIDMSGGSTGIFN